MTLNESWLDTKSLSQGPVCPIRPSSVKRAIEEVLITYSQCHSESTRCPTGLGGQVYNGGAGGLGGRLRGRLQHQRPHLLHRRRGHPAADSGGARGQLQRVRGSMRVNPSPTCETSAFQEGKITLRSHQILTFQLTED